nr:hypothetical protein KitaXyl93_68690 [Kitasatospora sp. Xyl93]
MNPPAPAPPENPPPENPPAPASSENPPPENPPAPASPEKAHAVPGAGRVPGA